MLVEELALGVAVDADVGIEADDLAAPEKFSLCIVETEIAVLVDAKDKILQRCLVPQAVGEARVVYLEAVVDADGVTFLGLPRGCGEGKRCEECDIVFAKLCSEQIGRSDYLIRQGMNQ